jgi:hypothetical protein
MAHESQNWSKLIGKDGAEAVEIIKQESGMIIETHFLFENYLYLLQV